VLRDLLLWVGLPVLAAAILAAAAMAMRRSTTVRVDLELSRLGLVVGGDSSNVLLLERTPVTALGIHALRDARLEGGRLQHLAADAKDCPTPGAKPGDEGLVEPLELVAGDASSSALIVETAKGALPATLDAVYVQPGAHVEVGISPRKRTGEYGEKPDRAAASSIRFSLADPGSRVIVYAPGLVSVDAHAMRIQDAAALGPQQFATLSLCAQAAPLTIEAHAGAQALHLHLTAAAGDVGALIPQGVPVAALDFTRQGEGGQRMSTVVGEGKIAYPNDPAREAIAIEAGDYVHIGGWTSFYIDRLDWLTQRQVLRLQAHGQVDELRVRGKGATRDLRLTWFDSLQGFPRLLAWLAFVGMVGRNAFAVWKKWKEIEE